MVRYGTRSKPAGRRMGWRLTLWVVWGSNSLVATGHLWKLYVDLSALGFWAWLTGVQKGRLNGKSLFLWGERLRAEVSGASVSPSHLVSWVPLLRGLFVWFVALVFVSCWCFQVPRFLQLLHVLLTCKRISDRQGYVLDRLWRKKKLLSEDQVKQKSTCSQNMAVWWKAAILTVGKLLVDWLVSCVVVFGRGKLKVFLWSLQYFNHWLNLLITHRTFAVADSCRLACASSAEHPCTAGVFEALWYLQNQDGLYGPMCGRRKFRCRFSYTQPPYELAGYFLFRAWLLSSFLPFFNANSWLCWNGIKKTSQKSALKGIRELSDVPASFETFFTIQSKFTLNYWPIIKANTHKGCFYRLDFFGTLNHLELDVTYYDSWSQNLACSLVQKPWWQDYKSDISIARTWTLCSGFFGLSTFKSRFIFSFLSRFQAKPILRLNTACFFPVASKAFQGLSERDSCS